MQERTFRYAKMLVAIIVVMFIGIVLLFLSLIRGNKEYSYEPSKNVEAIVGVEGVVLSLTSDMISDGLPVKAGTYVTVLEESVDVIRVRLADEKVYWCKRVHLCLPEEYELRKAKNQIPGPFNVTYLGLGENGGFNMSGYLPVRNGKVALLPDQLIRFSGDLCAKKETFDWGNSKIVPNPDAYYIIVSENELCELPSWPRSRSEVQLRQTK